jgi:hypothetical protein
MSDSINVQVSDRFTKNLYALTLASCGLQADNYDSFIFKPFMGDGFTPAPTLFTDSISLCFSIMWNIEFLIVFLDCDVDFNGFYTLYQLNG